MDTDVETNTGTTGKSACNDTRDSACNCTCFLSCYECLGNAFFPSPSKLAVHFKCPGLAFGGADGIRTRDLLRDRQARLASTLRPPG